MATKQNTYYIFCLVARLTIKFKRLMTEVHNNSKVNTSTLPCSLYSWRCWMECGQWKVNEHTVRLARYSDHRMIYLTKIKIKYSCELSIFCSLWTDLDLSLHIGPVLVMECLLFDSIVIFYIIFLLTGNVGSYTIYIQSFYIFYSHWQYKFSAWANSFYRFTLIFLNYGKWNF